MQKLIKSGLQNPTYLLIPLIFITYIFAFMTSGPFWDDGHFIFNSDNFKNSAIFDFWDKDSELYRAWPLLYSSFKVMYYFFGDSYFSYKLVNLIFHGFNSYLIFILLKSNTKISPLLPAIIFFVHPIAVESVSWIFQFGVVFSTFWAILSIKNFLKIDANRLNLVLVFVFFTLSILVKPIFIILPFYYLFNAYKTQNQTYLKVFVAILCLVMSTHRTLITISGVTDNLFERTSLNEIMKPKEEPKVSETKKEVTEELQIQEDIPNINLDQELKSNTWKKISLIATPWGGQNYTKTKSLGFYFLNTFGLVKNSMFHRNFDEDIDYFFITGILVVLLLLYLVFYLKKYELVLFFLCLYAPFSGIVYIPYMKYSFVSDHWAYSFFLFFIIFFIQIMRKVTDEKYLKYTLSFLLIIFSIKTFLYTIDFNNVEKNYKSMIKNGGGRHYPHLMLAEHYFKQGKLKSAKKVIIEAKSQHPENIELLNSLLVIQLKIDRSKSVDTIANISKLHLDRNDPEMAMNYLIMGMKINSKHPEILRLLQLVYMRKSGNSQ